MLLVCRRLLELLEMELKLGGGVGGNGGMVVLWWPPNFGEAETLVDGGQRRTASRKPFLGGLWLTLQ